MCTVDFPKPIITREPESQQALKSNNVSLACEAGSSSSSALTIVWKKDNKVGIVFIAGIHIKIQMWFGTSHKRFVHSSSSYRIAGKGRCVLPSQLMVQSAVPGCSCWYPCVPFELTRPRSSRLPLRFRQPC